MLSRKRLDIPFEIKSISDTGEFTGYGSVFGVKDSYSDIVIKGSFTNSLNKWKEKGRLPALLWQHKMDEPIGYYTKMVEDDNGLYLEGQLLIDDDPLAKRAHAHMKAKSLSGLSIGYILNDYEYDKDKSAFILKDIDLWEVSVVTFPSNDEARIDNVKSIFESGNIPSPKDIEQVALELKQQFTEFKSANDKRLEGITQEKAALAGQVETLNTKLSELDSVKTLLENELKEIKRPAGGNKHKSEHKEAFGLFIRKGNDQGLADIEQKAMQTGTDADGGYAVPEELNTDILSALRDEVVMRQECNVITVGTPDWKKLVNEGGISSGWVGETDARPETATPKLGVISPIWGEIYGNPHATQTMLDDAFFNVEAFITGELTTEFAEKEENAFTLGDGTKKPKGFLAYDIDTKSDKDRGWGKLQNMVSGAAAISTDDVVKLIYTLRKVYRAGAKFMMNNQSLLAVRLLKDDKGNYIWQPGLQLGQPSLLSGFAVAENEQMPDIGDASGKAPIAFGNFKRGFSIFDRIGIRMLRDPYTKKPFVGFYTTKRVGSMLNDSNAIKLLTMSTTKAADK